MKRRAVVAGLGGAVSLSPTLAGRGATFSMNTPPAIASPARSTATLRAVAT